MRIEPLGDSAWILRDLPAEPWRCARSIEKSALPGVLDVSSSYETVGIYVDPLRFDPAALESLEWTSGPETPKRHRIPVCYALGPDITQVASTLNLTEQHLAELHGSVIYRCFAVGFCPGFAYLGYLPNELANLPRLASPRARVEPGSVGITGRQTAVYPLPRPGGWPLIGKTPLTLVDVESGYFPIRAGDEVTFEPIDEYEFNQRLGHRP